MWLLLCVASAVVLGIYDVFKKWSVRDNAPLLVLFLSVCAGTLITLPVFMLSLLNPETASAAGLFCRNLLSEEHLMVFCKSVLVSVSWISAFFALKHLPISIVTPIRASAPLWTLLGAIILLNENLSPSQWAGISTILFSYFVFSLVGKKEGIFFLKNKWVLLVFTATLTGAASALYDKYLLRNAKIDPISLQVWFSFYLVGVIGTAASVVYIFNKKSFEAFKWRKSILTVGILLIVADYLYFRALGMEGALISVISTVRRSSVIISFIVGGLIFKEKNKRIKALPLAGVLIGVVLLIKSH